MLITVLHIFKIVMILIGSIAGLAILIILTVLFVPIRYHLTAKRDDEEFQLPKVVFKANWLLHLVRLKVRYEDGELNYQWYILFFSMKDRVGKGVTYEESGSDEEESLKKESSRPKQAKSTKDVTLNDELNTSGLKNKDLDQDEFDDEEFERAYLEYEKEKKGRGKFKRPSIKGLLDFLKHMFRLPKWIGEQGQKLKKWIKRTKYNLNWLNQRVVMVKDFFYNKQNKEGIRVLRKAMEKSLKHIRPSKYHCNVRFGTGDPASTGQMLGLLGFTYHYHHKLMQIQPDFENKGLEVDLLAKGKLRIITLVIISLKLYYDRAFKRLLYNFNRLKEEF